MSEKMSEVYEAYDMEILGAVRGRGSMILKTDRGIRQISPFDGSEERLALLPRLVLLMVNLLSTQLPLRDRYLRWL